MAWFPDRGVDSSAFVACPLEKVSAWLPTGKEMFYPLYTYQTASCPGYEPVNLLVNTQVVVYLNRLPLAHLGAGYQRPAVVEGKMRLWVGRWDSDQRYAFYYYAQRMVVPYCTNWVPTSLVLRNEPDNWELCGGIGAAIPVEEILAAPQQWGLGIEVDSQSQSGSGAPPLSNWLGFDRLSVTPAVCSSNTVWTVHPDPAFGADFLSIGEAIGSPCVQSGHTVRVWGGQTYNEIVFSHKALSFHGLLVQGARPRLTVPSVFVGMAPTHVTLEKGGEFLNFSLDGPTSIVEPESKLNGLAIMGPTLVSNCVVTSYSGMGFAGFCAANPNDIPSLIIANTITHNGQGVGNGDVEHVYRYNYIAENKVGAYTTTGSQARFIDNVIVHNTTQGVEIWQYGAFPPNQTEVANNIIAGNGGHGILLTYAHPANPNCPVIRDNIISQNAGYAIHAVDHSDAREPRLWALAADCSSGSIVDDSGKSWMVGGCYPRVDRDCFWMNNNGASDLADQFYSVTLTVNEVTRSYYTVPRGGRLLFTGCFAADPKLTADWRLAADSPCINAGSLYLDPGATLEDGRRDRGWLDIGSHFPAFLKPNLVVKSVAGDQVVIRADDIQLGFEESLIFVVEPTWSTPFGSIELIVSPKDLRAPQGFFWLR